MSGSPGTGGSNPRKFSEKIALHNQKQAEETRAFEQLMTDLTVSRVNALHFQLVAFIACRLHGCGHTHYGHSHTGAVTLHLPAEISGFQPATSRFSSSVVNRIR